MKKIGKLAVWQLLPTNERRNNIAVMYIQCCQTPRNLKYSTEHVCIACYVEV